MRAPSVKSVLKFLLLIAPVCSTHLCRGYTYLQVGVDSSLLIDGQRVVFAQADGSLTALSLDSGDVLVRDNSRNYSGTLRRVPQGILLLNDQAVALLNPSNFHTLWETTFHEQPNVTADALVSHDGQGIVQCRELETGRIRWTYKLAGDLDIIAEAGRVLVHRSVFHDGPFASTTALLDLQTGQELFSKTPPPGTNRVAAFFDGDNVYVAEGAFHENRSESEPERLATWNARGEETNSIPIPTELRQAIRARCRCLFTDCPSPCLVADMGCSWTRPFARTERARGQHMDKLRLLARSPSAPGRCAAGERGWRVPVHACQAR